MNFFQHQEKARRKTGLLVVLMSAAVLSLIIITSLAISIFMYYLGAHATSVHAYNFQQQSLMQHITNTLQSELILWAAAVVILVVALGSFYKFTQFSRGGRSVAEALGGRLLDSASQEPDERRVLNVVEEMAIASGNPVPPVYLIAEESINAFAAGFTRRDAVIGITRGCLSKLSRDELQGVIAHEFSHIHNSDMRLNMRLTAILHGILLIGLIGYYITHGSARNHRGKNNLIALGMVLAAIGYAGTFFGNIIKAAVSRQREFLADASAVQFTRNPQGISGALKKIGGYSKLSYIQHNHAAEFSHMYFAQGVKTFFAQLMATHPPLKQRITRIDKNWKGAFPNTDTYEAPHDEATGFAVRATETSETQVKELEELSQASAIRTHIADEKLFHIPMELHDASHSAFSARALIYALLLDNSAAINTKQLEVLKAGAHPVTFREMEKLASKVKELEISRYLTLISLCIPALKNLSQQQYRVFKKNLISLIQADDNVSFFEWCLYRIVTSNIEQRRQKENLALSTCKNEALYLITCTLQLSPHQRREAIYMQTLQDLPWARSVTPAFKDEPIILAKLDRSLNRLEKLKPLEKPKLLKVILNIMKADGEFNLREQEFFRAIADSLNCPIPPITIST